MSDRWITLDEAIALIRTRIGGSIGRAENTLRIARQSGEVRQQTIEGPLFLMADDGIVDMPYRRGVETKSGIDTDGKLTSRTISAPKFTYSISEDDLADWLNRHHGPASAAPTRKASTQEIRAAMFSIANDPANDRPNIKNLAKLTVARLAAAGAIASESQVLALDAPEFKALRRPPGKTKRSGG